MCGIAGFWDLDHKADVELLKVTVSQMSDTLVHRGPDASGTWVDEYFGIALGHRRLAVVDLSPEGAQPMYNDRYAMVFNGEVYNYGQLRKELSYTDWRGHSDTEVILQAFTAWGIENTLQKMIGMFAIALWDKQERCLHLMRDRMGEKPLYYGSLGKHFVFGSEIKALKQHYAWQNIINPDSVNLFLQYNCIPAPYSIYSDIYKLQPGHYLTVKASGAVQEQCYWQINPHVAKVHFSPEEAVTGLQQKLRESISLQMVADVPVGAFLSGGIDSSTVVALMQEQSSSPVQTFTIGFDDRAYNEAEQAKAIAQHLGTAHTELYCTASETQSLIPHISNYYDEPFADSSQVPTFMVSQLTRQKVTVSLSGDGGDELFAGYNRYKFLPMLWRKVSILPLPLRKLVAKLLIMFPPWLWDKVLFSLRNPGDKIHKLAGILDAGSAEEMYQRLISHWHCVDLKHLDHKLPLVEAMMYIDSKRYLPDDILVKVDRAAMAVSLETRVPMLDHRVVEYAWTLPLEYKIRNGQTKWVLQQVLEKYVPRNLFDRPKMGFGVPIDQWLRGPLRSWAGDLLGGSMLAKHGLLNAKAVNKKWQEHQSGGRNWQYHLWDILMFQAWYEVNHG